MNDKIILGDQIPHFSSYKQALARAGYEVLEDETTAGRYLVKVNEDSIYSMTKQELFCFALGVLSH